jgi:hypothetical protein
MTYGQRLDAALATGDREEVLQVLADLKQDQEFTPPFLTKRMRIRGQAVSGRTTVLVNRWKQDRQALLAVKDDAERTRVIAAFELNDRQQRRVVAWPGLASTQLPKGIARVMIDDSDLCPAPVQTALAAIGTVTTTVVLDAAP